MTNNLRLGRLGERLAGDFLENKGYCYLDRNFRYGKAEIDLVMYRNRQVIFVEVKTRLHHRYGYPEGGVSAKKERLYYFAAREFLFRLGHEGEVRFDIISIILEPETQIRHFEDAFFPGW